MAHPENERPRPHGDPLRDNVEDNPAQRESDAPGEEDDGAERRRQYEKNDAGLVSGID